MALQNALSGDAPTNSWSVDPTCTLQKHKTCHDCGRPWLKHPEDCELKKRLSFPDACCSSWSNLGQNHGQVPPRSSPVGLDMQNSEAINSQPWICWSWSGSWADFKGKRAGVNPTALQLSSPTTQHESINYKGMNKSFTHVLTLSGLGFLRSSPVCANRYTSVDPEIIWEKPPGFLGCCRGFNFSLGARASTKQAWDREWQWMVIPGSVWMSWVMLLWKAPYTKMSWNAAVGRTPRKIQLPLSSLQGSDQNLWLDCWKQFAKFRESKSKP